MHKEATHVTDDTKGRENMLRWKDIALSIKCHPEYSDDAKLLIQNYVGYYPGQPICLPYEPFIQTLIASHKSGQLREDDFHRELEFYARKMRNKDMETCWWAVKKEYDGQDHEHYNNYLPDNAEWARNRLIDFIGFEPKLELSLYAEISVRNILQSDKHGKNSVAINVEMRAATVVMYRDFMLAGGKDAADASGLVGLHFFATGNICPRTMKELK